MPLIECSFYKPENDAYLALAIPEENARALLEVSNLAVSRTFMEEGTGRRMGHIGGVVDLDGEIRNLNAIITFPGIIRSSMARVLNREPQAIVSVTIN